MGSSNNESKPAWNIFNKPSKMIRIGTPTVTFDEASRREFVTGFGKRKMQRKYIAKISKRKKERKMIMEERKKVEDELDRQYEEILKISEAVSNGVDVLDVNFTENKDSSNQNIESGSQVVYNQENGVCVTTSIESFPKNDSSSSAGPKFKIVTIREGKNKGANDPSSKGFREDYHNQIKSREPTPNFSTENIIPNIKKKKKRNKS